MIFIAVTVMHDVIAGLIRIEYPSDCGMEDMKLFCSDGD